jgi:hypothetical protein
MVRTLRPPNIARMLSRAQKFRTPPTRARLNSYTRYPKIMNGMRRMRRL